MPADAVADLAPSRRLSLRGDALRVDLVAPAEATLVDALAAAGIVFDPTRHALVTPAGAPVAPTARAATLVDGGVLVIIDHAEESARAQVSHPASERLRTDATWWLLGLLGWTLSAAAVVTAGASPGVVDGALRLAVPAGLGMGAVVCSAWWARGAAATASRHGAPLAAMAGIAFAAGALVADGIGGKGHSAVAYGLLVMAIVFAVIGVAARARVVRSQAGTLSSLAALLAGVWGATLAAGLAPGVPSALTLGIAVVVWRVLPSVVLDAPEGYAIDYRSFMSSRWTVRGAIPEDPGPVTGPDAQYLVESASARLVGGCVMMAAAVPPSALLVMVANAERDLVVNIGSIAVLTCAVLALLLMPRHATSATVRWAARGAAGAVVVMAVFMVVPQLEHTTRVGGAMGALLLAALAAALVMPLSRGVAALRWSRVADAVEGLAVALALPAALLASDAVDVVRGMVSG